MFSGAGSVVVLMVTTLKTQKHYSVSEMNLGVQVCPLVQYLSTMMFPLKGASSLFLSWALGGEVVIKVHADDVPLRRISDLDLQCLSPQKDICVSSENFLILSLAPDISRSTVYFWGEMMNTCFMIVLLYLLRMRAVEITSQKNIFHNLQRVMITGREVTWRWHQFSIFGSILMCSTLKPQTFSLFPNLWSRWLLRTRQFSLCIVVELISAKFLLFSQGFVFLGKILFYLEFYNGTRSNGKESNEWLI